MALAVALLCLLTFGPAAAMTAQEAFQDGNRLFRDDLYWAALLRYRQAGEAGMDTPLLHYNTGVAHYRAGHYERARGELLRAARSPGLRVLSQYNLGLTAYAAGNTDEALDWFRQARDQEENPQVRRLAIEAISRIGSAKDRAKPSATAAKSADERKLGEFALAARVGFGTDDNVYRTPDQAYVDYSDPNLPQKTPEPTSGAFIPLDLRARYQINSYEYESFFGEYRLDGRYYQDKNLENANDFSHELRIGSQYFRGDETRSTSVYSAFSIAQHDEIYFDPEDGVAWTVNGQPIEDRMNYVRYGPEFSVQRAYERLSLGLRVKGQMWDYADTKVVPQYDHEFFLLGVNAQYGFTEKTLLRLVVEDYVRRYGERPSYDLNGQQLVTNDPVHYNYLNIGLLARQRITPDMWAGLGYAWSSRGDAFEGYNDYTRNEFRFEYHWSPGPRFTLDLEGYYRMYDYPNAFAFNNPIAGPKTLDTAGGMLVLAYRMTPHLSLSAEAEYRGASSTDIRISYERIRYSLGVTWEQ
jgi:tetratricopeptide (TPR) repeat protein